MAAAVALVAFGLRTAYEQGHAEHRELVAAKQAALRDLETRRVALAADTREQEKEVAEQAKRLLHLEVQGQGVYQPGAAGTWQFTARDVQGRPVDAEANLRLVDPATEKEVLSQQVALHNGQADFSLTEAPSVAGREVRVEVAASAGPARAMLAERLAVAAPSYVAHLVTNKAAYHPGDVLFFRALALERYSLKPPTQSIPLRVELTDPAGKVVAGAPAPTGEGGVAAGELAVTDKLPAGTYSLRAAAAPGTSVAVRAHTRRLEVVRGTNYDVFVDRDKYLPGQKVNLSVARNSVVGGPAGPLDATVTLEGRPVPITPAPPAQTFYAPTGGGMNGSFAGGFGGIAGGLGGGNSAYGRAVPGIANSALSNSAGGYGQGFGTAQQQQVLQNFQFDLPKDIDANNLRLRVQLSDGKVKETHEQELAVVPSKLTVDFFPEGGDLVAGVPSRVWYRVRAPRGEAVDPEGRVIVLSSDAVLYDSAPREGAGTFTFTPKAGESYVVRVTGPGGALTEAPAFAKHPIKADGVVLHVPVAVGGEGEAVEAVVRKAGPARRVLLAAVCRGQLVTQTWADLKDAETSVRLALPAGTRGLVRVTVYEETGGRLTPRAERLVYRAPTRRLDLAALHLGAAITPRAGQKDVQLDVRARDAQGRPADCWALLAVVDERYKPHEPGLAHHFYVAGEVADGEGLDDALLVASDTPEARQALELFLGTAGWRRFVADRPAAALAKRGTGKADTRAGAVTLLSRENRPLDELREEYEATVARGVNPVRAAQARQTAELDQARVAIQSELREALDALRDYEDLPRFYFRLGLGVAIAILTALAVVLIAAGLVRVVRHRPATGAFVGACACLALVLVSSAVVVLNPAADVPAPGATADLARRQEPTAAAAPKQLARADVARPEPARIYALTDSLGRAAHDVVEGPAEPPQRAALDVLAAVRSERALNRLSVLAQRGQAKDGADARALDRATVPQEIQRRFRAAEERQSRFRVAPQALSSAAPAPAATTVAPPPAAPRPVPGAEPAKMAEAKKTEGVAKAMTQSETVRREYAGYALQYAPGLVYDTPRWVPNLHITGGSAQVSVELPGTPAAYRVLVLGHTAAGQLGYYEGLLDVQTLPGR
jgi:hypothetical protein